MIVLVVGIDGIRPLARPSERQAPVLIDPDCITAGLIAGQAMEPPAGNIHGVRGARRIENTQLAPEFGDMAGVDPARFTLPPEPLQGLAAKALGSCCPSVFPAALQCNGSRYLSQQMHYILDVSIGHGLECERRGWTQQSVILPQRKRAPVSRRPTPVRVETRLTARLGPARSSGA